MPWRQGTEGLSEWGAMEDSLFIGEMNCPESVIRSEIGSVSSFGFLQGELLLHSVFLHFCTFFFRFVSLVTLIDKVPSYVSRYRSYPPPS